MFSHSDPFSDRGMPVPEAELLYIQEVEKMEGYGQESFQAKVNDCHTEQLEVSFHDKFAENKLINMAHVGA